MTWTFIIISWLLGSSFIGVIFYVIGERGLAKKRKLEQEVLEEDEDLKARRQAAQEKVADLPPHGTVLQLMMTVSQLYDRMEMSEKQFSNGLISREKYKAHKSWLERQILKKTGTSYDDTRLNIDES